MLIATWLQETMKMLQFVYVLFFITSIHGLPRTIDLEHNTANVTAAENTLIYANIIFRHGYRTPTDTSTYKTDPHKYASYWPDGIGGLTKEGKLQMYKLGLELRKRYGRFLGDTYFPELIGALSSPTTRCQTSLQCVFAAMFPPKQEDLFLEDLKWQPFVYSILAPDVDDVFALYKCDGYWPPSKPNKTVQEFYEFLEEKSGDPIRNNSAVFIIRDCVFSQVSLGKKQPDWVYQIYPEPLNSIAALSYYDLLKHRMLLGASGLYRRLVRSFVAKLEGKLSPPRQKMMMFSGHEQTLFFAMAAITPYDGSMPDFGSYLAFEFHFINQTYGIKVYFQNYKSVDPVLLNVLGEGEFCPLEKFLEGVRWLSEANHPHCQVD